MPWKLVIIEITPTLYNRHPEYCLLPEEWNAVWKNSQQYVSILYVWGQWWPMWSLSVPLRVGVCMVYTKFHVSGTSGSLVITMNQKPKEVYL
jgi:hypothetical protein